MLPTGWSVGVDPAGAGVPSSVGGFGAVRGRRPSGVGRSNLRGGGTGGSAPKSRPVGGSAHMSSGTRSPGFRWPPRLPTSSVLRPAGSRFALLLTHLPGPRWRAPGCRLFRVRRQGPRWRAPGGSRCQEGQGWLVAWGQVWWCQEGQGDRCGGAGVRWPGMGRVRCGFPCGL